MIRKRPKNPIELPANISEPSTKKKRGGRIDCIQEYEFEFQSHIKR